MRAMDICKNDVIICINIVHTQHTHVHTHICIHTHTHTEYKALYDHQSSVSGDLSFKEGDTILVYRANSNGWWYGSYSNMEGWFPGSYVEVRLTHCE